ncbi:Cop9 signalosome complex subunit [Thalictrum thalictroides]|uniref:COP9 signalosome complex subunit 3 n=1 Tax=Thalictrum thalictroides TaxID=46969 RepID=A0A7J6WC80_THATH|nr:Cop9 signalosome complex subunit [Thalictrum thalictroides]
MDDALDVLVKRIQGLSSRDDDIPHLHKLLREAEGKGLLCQSSSRLAFLLEQLDPSQHSLGYLYILEAYTSTPSSNDQARGRLPTVAGFIDSCVAEQIRLVPDKFISVCRAFKDGILSLKTPIRGVGPLRTAIRKLQSSSGRVTSLHSDFVMLCLLAKCYKTGYSILEENIFETDQPRDLYLYCYYGGMICIGQKCYGKAIELLSNVITAPSSTMSAISIEARKKYILVSLILNGQLLKCLPKHENSITIRRVKSLCQHYLDLAEVYSTGEIFELESFVETNRQKFESENNLGLVRQVISSLYKRNIQRLTQTYLTLSLQDIANRVSTTPREAEMHVLQMIQDGEIFASINQKDGMVNFHEDPEQYKSCNIIEHIDSSIQRIMALSKKLNDVDEFISCDTAYLAKVELDRRHQFDFDDYDQPFFM